MKNIVSKFVSIAQRSFSFANPVRVGVDYGTSMTRICIGEKGIVLREPTFVGINTKNNEALFFGSEAKDIYGKSPTYINIVKPVENSIISDFDATVALIQMFLKKSVYPFYHASFIRKGLAAYTVVPTSSTEVEQKALQEALIKAGFQSAYLIEKPLASAYGSGQDVFSNRPLFTIDLGAGIVEMSIVIMGGVVTSKVMKLGGDHMDKLIHGYLHLKYGLIIGDLTAELLKNKLYNFEDKKGVLAVRGKSLENGLPKSVRVTSADIREALAVPMNQIVDGIKELIETVPPEIIDGLIKNGAMLTGNLANIPGIAQYISSEIKIPINVATKPEDATAHGIMKLMEDQEKLKRVLIHS